MFAKPQPPHTFQWQAVELEVPRGQLLEANDEDCETLCRAYHPLLKTVWCRHESANGPMIRKYAVAGAGRRRRRRPYRGDIVYVVVDVDVDGCPGNERQISPSVHMVRLQPLSARKAYITHG